MNPGTELWRVKRVAEALDVTKKRVYNLIREGRLEAIRLSEHGIRVPRRSVDKLIEKGRAHQAKIMEDAFL